MFLYLCSSIELIRSCTLFQQALNTNIQKITSFLQFSRSFIIRNNPIKQFLNQIQASFKDFLTMNKKIKMARYRVNYQKYKLAQMEQLIAQNNEHVFLRGRTINETR